MWGNIFSGVMSLAQGDSPEEILKKQAMSTVMGGTAPVGVDSASNSMMSTLAEQGVADAGVSHLGSQLGNELSSNMVTQNPALTNGLGQSSNMLTQFGRDAGGFASDTFGGVGDTLSGVGDTLSEYGTAVNDFTGMEAKDWTQLGIQGGSSALEGTPTKPISHAPVVTNQGTPTQNQMGRGLLSSHVKPNSPQGYNPNMMRQLRMRGLV